ncbi:MAG: hypothetical protein RL432_150 [Bacteroidota bacterium]
MKTILLSLMLLLGLGTSDKVTKCVEINCKNTKFVVSMTGTNEADIAKQIKKQYPNCSFTYVDKSRCKN